jgi:hypothetical protein
VTIIIVVLTIIGEMAYLSKTADLYTIRQIGLMVEQREDPHILVHDEAGLYTLVYGEVALFIAKELSKDEMVSSSYIQ